MNIFELSNEFQKIMDKINAQDYIDEALMEELMAVNDDFENKILNYASIIKSIESKAS